MKLLNLENTRASMAPFETIEQLNANTDAIRTHFSEVMTPTEKAVLDVLHRFASKHFGVSYLSKTSIAEKVGVSRRQVIRVCNKFEAHGIIAQYATDRRAGGGQTSNTIVFLTQVSARSAFVDNVEKVEVVTANVTPDVTGLDAPKDALKELKYLRDTKATKAPANAQLKKGLLEKIPQAIRQAVEPFFSSLEDIYRLVGAVYNGKKAVDKSVRIEDHEQVYYTAVISVIEGWKRAVSEKRDFDVFRVMFKAAKDATESILDGSAYEVKANIKRYKSKFGRPKKIEVIPDWFESRIDHDNPTRPVPEWFRNDLPTTQPEQDDEVDYASIKEDLLRQLGY